MLFRSGSFLDARAHGGRWLLRIEDVDTPRTGESIPIKARNVVTFHASHKLKSIVQGDTPTGEDFE